MNHRPADVVLVATVPIHLYTHDQELIEELSRNHTVHVVSSPGWHLDALEVEFGVTPHPIPMTRDTDPRDVVRSLRTMVRLFRDLQPVLVFTATPKASLIGQAAARLTGVPARLYHVTGLRLEGETGLRRLVLRLGEMATGAAASAVVVNSQSLMARSRELRLFPAGRLHVTKPGSTHGVNSALFTPGPPDAALARELGLEPGVPVVGFVGRLTHDKGLAYLRDAMQMLRANGQTGQLLIVGQTDETDSADQVALLRDSGVPVTFTGNVPREQIAAYYRLMDVHVLPSLREGFPSVALEAAACAIPTVTTTATGCIDSVIDGFTGRLVPPRDAPALASAIDTLLGDPDAGERMGAAAREWAVGSFAPRDIVASLLEPVRDVVDA